MAFLFEGDRIGSLPGLGFWCGLFFVFFDLVGKSLAFEFNPLGIVVATAQKV
jgi:hypothetical protein